MKKNNLVRYLMILSFGIILVACSKNDEIPNTHIIGAYTGTLTTNLENLQGSQINSKSATAIVTSVGKQIEVYCYNDDFNITVLVNIYENGDYMMTCLSGQEFENMYGHSLSQENMVGYMQNNNLQWMQHLDLEHIESDIHNGFFNMLDNSFKYTFLIDDMEYHFEGVREFITEEVGF
ncbi:hypothetical protein BX611_1939 [Lutibacter oceani]|jgi:hypothetical protein|uniref:Lipoprotein n=1 Tax=Lutibacter oceani TaxID=1853311 RepID=A0A3D9RKL0_9FLAO|nr:hypothetical protein [Lutibacter oceani]REE80297.1 hypothetical protein BX611_1939 [Lutibacter oceani]